jgi:uncharacterized protein YjhX (UPF0386 family)
MKRSLWAGLDLQHLDSHKQAKCKRCGAEIVWLKSKAGKPYPVNHKGLIDVMKNDFHRCLI